MYPYEPIEFGPPDANGNRFAITDRERIAALRAEVERLKVMAWDWQMKHDEQAAEADRLRDALESIEANTCCGPRQEAALVARAALNRDADPTPVALPEEP